MTKILKTLKFLLLFVVTFTNGQGIKNIPASGASIQAFVPSGWFIKDSVKTDFNNDSLKDFSAVLQKQIPFTTKNKECEGEEIYPRILLIGLNQGGKYDLSVKTEKIFGECNWGLQGGDPFSDLDIRKNTLKIEFFTGGTLRIVPVYYFKFRNEKWILIGYTNTQYESPSNDAYIEDYNLIKGIKESYNLIKGQKKNLKTSSFPPLTNIELENFDATGGGVKGLTY